MCEIKAIPMQLKIRLNELISSTFARNIFGFFSQFIHFENCQKLSSLSKTNKKKYF